MKAVIIFIVMVILFGAIVYGSSVKLIPPAACEAMTLAIIIGGGLWIVNIVNHKEA